MKDRTSYANKRTKDKNSKKSKRRKRKQSSSSSTMWSIATIFTISIAFVLFNVRSSYKEMLSAGHAMETLEALAHDIPLQSQWNELQDSASRMISSRSDFLHSDGNANGDSDQQTQDSSNLAANHGNNNGDHEEFKSIIIPNPKSPYAYVYLVGGINEKAPSYRGFILNVVISAQVLADKNSKADIICFCQFVAESDLMELPHEDARLLEALNVHIHYLPKVPKGDTVTFYDVIFEKFKVLLLVQYRRVLFLDSDTIPLENLDYMFELSDKGANSTLKENAVFATRGEPANAGFMMMAPKLGEYEHCEQIRAQQIESVKDMPPPKFDWIKGWGHSFIEAKDRWEAIEKKGRRWNYWSAHADQGLLYYWVKYAKREGSLIIGNRIQNWSTDANGKKFMEKEMIQPLDSLSEPYGQPKWKSHTISDSRPYIDFSHFTGNSKPWVQRMPPGSCTTKAYGKQSPRHFWFHVLCHLNQKLEIGMDMSNWTAEKERIGAPPLGGVPNWSDMNARMDKLHGNASKNTTATAIGADAGLANPSNSVTDNGGDDGGNAKFKSIIIPGAKSPYAYVYLVGGINEKAPSYRGFLLTVVISAQALAEMGAKADTICFCQLVAESDREKLPEEDARLLAASNVHVHYLPKIRQGENSSFYDVIFEKFKVLLLTQYRRALFLDSDTIPLENLDYMFEFSDQGANSTLKETVVVATRGEPANAGFILFSPKLGEYEHCEEIRTKQIESVKDRPYPKFDFVNGWGHNFKKNGGQWEGIKQTGRRWDYWSAHADQGLLYYWVRFAKQEGSLVIGHRIQNWSTDANGKKFMEREMIQPLNSLPEPYGEPKWRDHSISDNRPYISFSHFTGKRKPWLKAKPRGDCMTEAYGKESPKSFWFHMLCKTNEKLTMGMDMSNWAAEKGKIGQPPFGGVPNWSDMSARMDKMHADGNTRDVR